VIVSGYGCSFPRISVRWLSPRQILTAGITQCWDITPLATPAKGVMLWEYLIVILTLKRCGSQFRPGAAVISELGTLQC
jgi:hypothetical protein